MKKICVALAFSLLLCLLGPHSALAAPAAPDIVSGAAVLMDADTGQVLFQKKIHRRMAPASVTKIMTALLLVECAEPGETAVVSGSAVDIAEPDSTNMELSPGEELTVEDALYGLMLASANDVANVLGEHITGSQDHFAQMMTERAGELGAVNTHFANPHGLDEPQHYTTAYDIALITRFAIQNESFRKYFGAVEHSMPATNLHDGRSFKNYHLMLRQDREWYDPRVTGGKIGYTDDARHTMSTVAAQDGRTLICVVLYAEDSMDKYADTKALFDFGFSGFSPCTVPVSELPVFSVPIGTGEFADTAASFHCGSDITLLLPEGYMKEDLRLSYSHPGYFSDPEQAACTLSFSVPGGDTRNPESLLEVQMEVTIQDRQALPASLARVYSQQDTPGHEDLLKRAMLILLAVAGAPLLLRSRKRKAGNR